MRKYVLSLLLVFSFACNQLPAYGASNIVSNFSLLKVGCYIFTDKLEVAASNEALAISSLPDAFLGKSASMVSCSDMHHLEISSITTSKIVKTLRVDSIPMKSQCIINNIRMLNTTHTDHEAQTYFKTYRGLVSNRNTAICGVLAASYVHPKFSEYKIYEPFVTPHLKLRN